uniref:Uncharacterized protein n=1 Tax=Cafeteria roenbergensis TaxID=33653 RepID=A0A7S0JYR2_CAFRO
MDDTDTPALGGLRPAQLQGQDRNEVQEKPTEPHKPAAAAAVDIQRGALFNPGTPGARQRGTVTHPCWMADKAILHIESGTEITPLVRSTEDQVRTISKTDTPAAG